MKPYSSDGIKRKKRRNSSILNKLLGAIPEVKSAAIVSAEGLPIASALPQGIDETKIAAMTAALLSLSEMAIIEMNKGDFDQIYIKGSEGYLLVMQAGPNAVLTVSTTKDVRLGLILLDCRRICEKISGLLSGDFDFDDEGDGHLPYPHIGNPPDPPVAPRTVTQLRVKKSTKKKTKNETVCQYCGMTLTEEERISHNCRKSP